MSEANASGDSSELEALFDSIAGGGAYPAPPPVAAKDSLIGLVQEGGDLTDDSRELQELFDKIAGQRQEPDSPVEVLPPAAVKDSLIGLVQEGGDLTDDSRELQELFDSIAGQRQEPGPVAEAAAAASVENGEDTAEWSAQQKVFDQVGQMVRQLRETLRALGYDKVLEDTVNALPDAKDRLSYISILTERAASRVLNATDEANPLQEELEEGAVLLAEKWDSLYDNRMGVEDFKLLANDTREFLRSSVPQKTFATKELLLEIMMAQDFQDLTGQVIKRLIVLTQSFESQLMDILIETIPGEKRTESVNSLLNGPVVNADGRSDVVVSQEQVDDLLDSLGF